MPPHVATESLQHYLQSPSIAARRVEAPHEDSVPGQPQATVKKRTKHRHQSLFLFITLSTSHTAKFILGGTAKDTTLSVGLP